MQLPLAYYGDPILRKKCPPVPEINDEIRQLVKDMVETMHINNGAGLAAPQVHRSLALFICCVDTEGPDDTWIPGKLRVFINPRIVAISQEYWQCGEGCISIPKLYGQVIRPLKVVFEATNLEGELYSEELFGMEARCFLHENDHINGVLYIDRMNQKDRKEFEPLLREVKKKYYQKK